MFCRWRLTGKNVVYACPKFRDNWAQTRVMKRVPLVRYFDPVFRENLLEIGSSRLFESESLRLLLIESRSFSFGDLEPS